MLVLTRKLGEEIIIGGDIRVTVVEVANGRVKLGVVAPKTVRVDRAEVHELREQADAPLPPATPRNRLPVAQADSSVVVTSGSAETSPTLPNRLPPAARPPFKRKAR